MEFVCYEDRKEHEFEEEISPDGTEIWKICIWCGHGYRKIVSKTCQN